VFAGDGLCTDDETARKAAADAFNTTGAIIHAVAVGDEINCDEAQLTSNNLDDFPRNGGKCHSIPDPDTKLPKLVDDLIGTTLVSLEVQVDGANYKAIANGNLSNALPLKGANSTDFVWEVEELAVGNHTICVRATGNDTLGLGLTLLEDCHEVIVMPFDNKFQGWQIALIATFSLGCIAFLTYAAVRIALYGKESASQNNLEPGGKDDGTADLELEESGNGEGTKAGNPIV